jgi:hypothetical protein
MTTINYGQGATIGFYAEGDININLDANDFTVLIYRDQNNIDLKFSKADMTSISTNKYYGEIANTVTKTLPFGTYTVEVLIGDAYTSVAKSEAFNIFATRIKKYVV